MIQIYNRKSGELEIENPAGEKWLLRVYDTSPGRFFLHTLLKRKWYTALSGFFCDLSISRKLIPGFAAKNHINMEEAEEALDSYPTFNAFFTRRLKKGCRPFADAPALISPGDGRIQVFTAINPEKLPQIKGSTYRLRELLKDKVLAENFAGGSCVLLRLAPIDYHRFHFIDNGPVEDTRFIPGSYYSVNPIALRQVNEVYPKNARAVTLQHGETLGDFLYVEVGAASVGSITEMPLATIPQRGDEKGYFSFGGSTILLFFKKDAVVFDEDLLKMSRKGLECHVLAGEKIGTIQTPKAL